MFDIGLFASLIGRVLSLILLVVGNYFSNSGSLGAEMSRSMNTVGYKQI